jgi:paraquat-inducible protein B
MSKKANPTVIGTFVLGAIILAGAAFVILGSGKMFEKTSRFVLYFEGDVAGLDEGAAVTYRGIRIGSVSEMRLEMNTDTGIAKIPVYVEVEPDRMVYKGSRKEGRGMAYQVHERGLRAQLQSDSLITGKRKIALLEDPESPIQLVGGDPSVEEIPTIPTLTEALKESLHNLPLGNIVSNMNATLESIADLMGSSEMEGAIASISSSTAHLDELLTELDKSVPTMMSNATATAQEAQRILAELRPAVTNVGPLLVSARQSLDLFQGVEEEMTEAIAEAKNLLDARSPARYEFTRAMERVGAAADAFGEFVDYLQRHPEALLAGKGTSRGSE